MVTILYSKSLLRSNNRTTVVGESVFCKTVCVWKIQKAVHKLTTVNSNKKILFIIAVFIFSKLLNNLNDVISTYDIIISRSFKYRLSFFNESSSSFLFVIRCKGFPKQIYLFVETIFTNSYKRHLLQQLLWKQLPAIW